MTRAGKYNPRHRRHRRCNFDPDLLFEVTPFFKSVQMSVRLRMASRRFVHFHAGGNRLEADRRARPLRPYN